MKVVCIGSANMEILFSRDSLPRAMTGEDPLEKFSGGKYGLTSYGYLWGEKITEYSLDIGDNKQVVTFSAPSTLRLSPGGGAVAIALGLAGAGAEVKVITALADNPKDFFSAGIKTYLEKKGMQFLSVFSRQATPVTFIIWGLPEGVERSIVFAYKPPYHLKKKQIERVLRDLRAEQGVTHLVAAGIRQLDELPFIASAFAIAEKYGVVTCFTPNEGLLAPTKKSQDKKKMSRADKKKELERKLLLGDILRKTKILQINEREVAVYLGLGRRRLRFPEDVKALADIAKVPITIVTRSAKGVAAVIDGQYYQIPAFPPQRIQDTSGAGDAFTVGFLFGHDRKCSPIECLRLGAYSASGNIGFPGGHAGIPKGDALLQYLQQLQQSPTESTPS
ncbi:MAG: carbohydrate kinase family protein [bacterium]|nr:carbohydrate kinase family protein [bacterium]